jgi:hypothetical protein
MLPYQKSQYWYILEGSGMEMLVYIYIYIMIFGYFNGHLVYVMAAFIGYLVLFSRLGILYQKV